MHRRPGSRRGAWPIFATSIRSAPSSSMRRRRRDCPTIRNCDAFRQTPFFGFGKTGNPIRREYEIYIERSGFDLHEVLAGDDFSLQFNADVEASLPQSDHDAPSV